MVKASGQKHTPAIRKRQAMDVADYGHVLFCDNCRKAQGVTTVAITRGFCCGECVARKKNGKAENLSD